MSCRFINILDAIVARKSLKRPRSPSLQADPDRYPLRNRLRNPLPVPLPVLDSPTKYRPLELHEIYASLKDGVKTHPSTCPKFCWDTEPVSQGAEHHLQCLRHLYGPHVQLLTVGMAQQFQDRQVFYMSGYFGELLPHHPINNPERRVWTRNQLVRYLGASIIRSVVSLPGDDSVYSRSYMLQVLLMDESRKSGWYVNSVGAPKSEDLIWGDKALIYVFAEKLD